MSVPKYSGVYDWMVFTDGATYPISKDSCIMRHAHFLRGELLECKVIEGMMELARSCTPMDYEEKRQMNTESSKQAAAKEAAWTIADFEKNQAEAPRL